MMSLQNPRVWFIVYVHDKQYPSMGIYRILSVYDIRLSQADDIFKRDVMPLMTSGSMGSIQTMIFLQQPDDSMFKNYARWGSEK